VGNVYSFGLRTESIKKDAFPIDIDFMLERNGEFERDDETATSIYAQENFKRTPEYNGKTFVSFASQNYVSTSSGGYYLLDASKVKLNEEDGYYHIYDEATDTFGSILYTKINKDFEVISTDSGKGFMDDLVNLRLNGKDYSVYFMPAYVNYVNSDGVYAVTKELQVFLQEFAVSQRLFSDGNGFAEVYFNYQSSENNQWLFNCGIYI
jgi:hypothetical protein